MGELVELGVDIETGGLSPETNPLLQVAVYHPPSGRVFRSDVRPEPGADRLDAETLAVNGFTAERAAAAPTRADVDARLEAFLESVGVAPARGVPVGFNVGAFDMPFIRRNLNRSGPLFTRRSIDLNAVCFALAPVVGRNWQSLKAAAVQSAARCINVVVRAAPQGYSGFRPHDAGYDAMEAWYCLKHLREVALPYTAAVLIRQVARDVERSRYSR